MGEHCYKAFTGRNKPCPNCPTEKSLKSGKIEHSIICEENVKGIEGTSYWADYAVPIKNESGDIVNFIQVSRDITNIKRAEAALIEEKEKLEAALKKVKKLSGFLTTKDIGISSNHMFLIIPKQNSVMAYARNVRNDYILIWIFATIRLPQI